MTIKPKFTRYVLILLSIGSYFSSFSQLTTNRLQKIQYDKELNNHLFHSHDSLKDSIYLDAGLPYFNMPINSNCVTQGDFMSDTLCFVSGYKKGDTLIIGITNPVVCCYYFLRIKIINGQFCSDLTCSYDISPSNVFILPEQQRLVLRKKGNDIEGFVSFRGKGKYTTTKGARINNNDKKLLFKQNVKGYFKFNFG